MDNAIYATLTRQSGLMKEMEVVANNIANADTTGYRRQGVVFSEYVAAAETGDSPLSMAWAHGRLTDLTAGGTSETGAPLDFAIEGEGFFQIQTPAGVQLTRAGSFLRNGEGQLVTPDGVAVLDIGGAPIAVPDGAVALASDGTLSANGAPFAQIGVVVPAADSQLLHTSGTRFSVEGTTEPAGEIALAQGRVESSNVDSVTEIARMVAVQRAYELGQSLLDREDERIRNVISTLSQ